MNDTPTPSPFAFQESEIWQQAMTLAEQVYAKTERFPLREHAGLANQMRDSAQKLAATIAANHFGDAQSYGKMLFTQATLAARLGHLNTDDALSILVDVEALSGAIKESKPAPSANAERSSGRSSSSHYKRSERNDSDRNDRNYTERKPRTYMRSEPKTGERNQRSDGERSYAPRAERKPEERGESRPRPDKRTRESARSGFGDKRVKRNPS